MRTTILSCLSSEDRPILTFLPTPVELGSCIFVLFRCFEPGVCPTGAEFGSRGRGLVVERKVSVASTV
ncbi:hypothetical protein PM082_024234 [Marasmius tenuissimus]|nr:hypothetical protein PM082_024234 [Marasmius tenuissimus]